MMLLLTRDWRTRVAGEAGDEAEALRILSQPTRRVDAILLDTEIPGDPPWPFALAQVARSRPRPPAILCTGTRADAATLERIVREKLSGYIVKGESRYALASAVALAASGQWVMTPGVRNVAQAHGVALPKVSIVLDGRKPVAVFTRRENEIARLATLFSLGQRDLADELQIRPDEVGKVVSRVYEKLGLHEILTGEIPPEAYFDDEAVLNALKAVLKQVSERWHMSGRASKPRDMSTLAFHLLTLPEVEKLY